MSNVRKLFLGHSESTSKPRPAIRNQVYVLLRIWRNYDHHDYGIERLVRLFLATSQFLSLSLYLKHFTGRWGIQTRKLVIELYVLLKVAFPLAVFALGWNTETWALTLLVYLLFETILYVTSLVFLNDATREVMAPRRSLILLFLNFFEITFDFAVIYSFADSRFGAVFNRPLTHGMDAIYFSFVTAATVGYGDFTPVSAICKVLVINQIALTFVFVGLFLNYFSGMLHRINVVDTRKSSRKTSHARKRK